ncbi:reverse transcriptase [Corchorus capsularis]|uniref:Reverse transcriptase n=1 Tax=Corchorus capsularis TaxID=210143 RepID=A0A1R3GC81_COCAP|nr:reverse transcriptase [Corchorus capsularis]
MGQSNAFIFGSSEAQSANRSKGARKWKKTARSTPRRQNGASVSGFGNRVGVKRGSLINAESEIVEDAMVKRTRENCLHAIAKKKKEFDRAYFDAQLGGNSHDLQQCQDDLDCLYKREEVMWKQRSKAFWLKEGDRNTGYFHSMASTRQHRNLISGPDITHMALSFLNQGGSLPNINSFRIVLILKIDSPVSVKDYWSISLCNVVFKIISKALVNRLKVILPELIGENQSAFVPDRMIFDSDMIAFETVHFMKKKLTKRQKYMALKLDLSKAYDRVKWVFLENIMWSMGFPNRWGVAVNRHAPQGVMFFWRVVVGGLVMECISWLFMINGLKNPRTFTPRPRTLDFQPNDMRVSELIDLESKTWINEVLEDLFLEEDCLTIRCIPLSLHTVRVTLIWNFDSLGRYSVRSGYVVPRKLLGREDFPLELRSSVWKLVWSANIYPKVKYFIWRLIWAILPAKTILQQRGINIEVACEVLWRYHNRCLHDHIYGTSVALVSSVTHHMQQMMEGATEASTNCPRSSRINWSPPPPGTLKVNTDAAFDISGGKAGLGAVIRDHHRAVLCCATKRMQFVADSLHAEINKKEPMVWEGACLILEIRELAKNFEGVRFVHTRRDANMCAHSLAKFDCHMFASYVRYGVLSPGVCNSDSLIE